jgi:hypothetical protein
MAKGYIVLNATLANTSMVATIKNTTGISALENATIGCLPGLLTHTTHHKTVSLGITTSSTLSTGVTTVTPTKPVKGTVCCIPDKAVKPVSLKGHSKDWRIGYGFGLHDGAIAVYDPPGSCGEPQHVTNQTECGLGYRNGYVTACTAKTAKFGCQDGPSSLSNTPPTSNSSKTLSIMSVPLVPGNTTGNVTAGVK